MAAELG